MRRAWAGCGCVVVELGLLMCGCGGGGQSTVQPPPPQADFTMALSASSVSVQDGGTSAPITVSVSGQNGFSGNVQVSLSNLPAGISSLPASPFAVSAGKTVSVIFGAGASAVTGQFSVMAQGTSGALAHSAALSLSVQAAVAQNLSKSTFIRDDSVASLDHRAGEAVHRHIVFDAAGQRFFVANRAMNRVEVFAAGNPSLQATIDAPGASSVDLSADGKTLWVGTELEQLLAVDTGLLQVKQRVTVSGLAPIPNVIFNRPTEAYAMASGKLLVRLRQPAASESLLAVWDPGTNRFTDLTSAAPGIFQAGAGVMARSGDQTKLLVAANDASGAGVFDGSGNLLAGPQNLGGGNILYAAANQDGSRLALVIAVNGATQLMLLDGGLNLLGTYAAIDERGVVFSQDGQTLYVGQALGGGRVVTALSVSNLQVAGEISDLGLQSVATVVEGIGGAKLLCGLSNRGVSFLDASAPAMLGGNAPEFAGVPAAQPGEGGNAGGTAILLSGSNFAANPAIAFGGMNAVAGSGSGTQIAVTSPASASSGAVNVTAYFSNGWVAMAPAAFSYGPSIERIFPNTASKAGGDTIEIYGFGFGSDAGKVTVKIGGQSATVQKVENLSAFTGALGIAANYPFAMERLTVTAPGGAAGKADVLVQAPSGSASAVKALQFLEASATSGSAGLYKFILYDQARQFVYMTATDHVGVFDLKAQAFRSSIEPPPNGPPPDAALRGLAMTPDGTQLVVADFGAQSIYLISPDGAALNGAKVPVGGVPGFLNSGPARVAATSAQTVFVGLSGEGGASGACNACLGQMDLMASPPSFQPAPQPEVTALTGAPLLQANGSGDTVYLAFGSAPGGPVAAWSASTPNSFAVSAANDSSSDLASAGDGTMFAMRSNGMTEIRAADLTLMATPASAEIEGIAGRVMVPGITLHPTGALVYEPFLDGPAPSAPPATGIRGGVDIRDAHNGQLRLRVYLPEPFAMLSTDVDGLHGVFLTLDENGQKLFAITSSGLTVVQLANVPLGVGSLAPAIGAAAGGTSVTLRGSGFVSGTRVTIGGKAATATYKDMNTLQLVMPAVAAGAQRVVLTNPDGESVGLDAAYLAQ